MSASFSTDSHIHADLSRSRQNFPSAALIGFLTTRTASFIVEVKYQGWIRWKEEIVDQFSVISGALTWQLALGYVSY